MMRPRSVLALACVSSLALLSACGGSGGGKTPTVIFAPNSFHDVTKLAGLDLPHSQVTITANGAGAAAGDYDGDGNVDILVLRDRNLPALLFRNLGDGRFEEVSAAAGLVIEGNSCGPCFADIDGDGHLDLLVLGAVDKKPQLFHNQGNGTFKDITAQSGLVVSGDSCSAAFGDYDRDGDLDVFITRWERNHPTRGTDEHLWRNNGDLTFTDVSVESQISKTIRTSPQGDLTFTPNWADVNNDGWPDLLIAADFKTSCIYINKKDGTFENTTTSIISDDNGMGGAVADYDNDGDLDWLVTSIWHPDPTNGWTGNRLYRNRGDGTFEDATTEAGVREGYWGWGCSFADFDHDGHLDIAHVNGWFRDGFEADASRLFMANGDSTFTEASQRFGFVDRDQGRGLICFDYDNDGDLDLFVENLDQPWRLFRNNLDKGNHLTVKLRGKSPNSEAIGARVYVTIGGKTQMREIQCGNNFISQNPAHAHFGLGTATSIDTLRIVWPDDSETVFNGVDANQRLQIAQ